MHVERKVELLGSKVGNEREADISDGENAEFELLLAHILNSFSNPITLVETALIQFRNYWKFLVALK